jgi:hypothetical protein
VDGSDFGHWFVGDLKGWAAQRQADPASPGLRQTSDVEIKWGLHLKGEQRNAWADCSNKRTLSLLVRGRFLLRFRSPQARHQVSELRLLKEGDYAIWSTDVEHIWEVEEDAVILTVRWSEATSSAA